MTDIRRCEHNGGWYISTFVAHDVNPSVIEVHRVCNLCHDNLGRAFTHMPPPEAFSYYDEESGEEVFTSGGLHCDTP